MWAWRPVRHGAFVEPRERYSSAQPGWPQRHADDPAPPLAHWSLQNPSVLDALT
jgi:hypothetical protein